MGKPTLIAVNEWILGRVSGNPCRFCMGGHHSDLAKEREPGIVIIKCTSSIELLIITIINLFLIGRLNIHNLPFD